MVKISRYLLIALVALTATGCKDPLAPLTSTRIDIHGPDRAYGEYSQWNADRGESPYVCQYSLAIRATGDSANPQGEVRFAGALFVIRDEAGNEVDRYSVSARDLDRMLGYRVAPGQTLTTPRFDVEGPVSSFRWSMELNYFDQSTGYTRTADFSSRCIVD